MNKIIALPFLPLGDLAGKGDFEVREWITTEFRTPWNPAFVLCIAFLDDGSYDSQSWFLLRKKGTNDLFEVHASHCSCYGYEDQWTPEPTTVEYLKSDKFGKPCRDWAAVNAYIQENL